jgi:hypothetical protein
MDVKKLFNGIVVIIDDEIADEKSQIFKIKKFILDIDIPVATYNEIPSKKVITALANAAFIILDWDFGKNIDSGDGGDERIQPPDTFTKLVIDFIKELMKSIFVPLFIFTQKNPEEIQEQLKDSGLWNYGQPNRIFIKQKRDLTSEKELFEAIEGWLKEMPSIYALKEWEQVISATKSKMFLEMYEYSPKWAKIIWDILKKDGLENHRKFGDFITRNLINRTDGYVFDEAIFELESEEISRDELLKVVEGEKYISYNNQPQQAYAGDLFIGKDNEKDKDNKYYLNIRAQCDLARVSDPELYRIKGEELADGDIIAEYIKLTHDKKLYLNNVENFTLDALASICENKKKLNAFNNKFKKYRNNAFFINGDIISKRSEIVVVCIAGKKAIKFKLDISVEKFEELKKSGRARIGRVLPPHITRIQQSCAAYIVREGTMPIPSALFT